MYALLKKMPMRKFEKNAARLPASSPVPKKVLLKIERRRMLEKNVERIYRNALAVFLNQATDNVDAWFGKLFPDASPGSIDAIQRVKGENDAANQMKIFDSAITHFFFLQWLYNRRSYFVKPNDEAAAANNYQKLKTWIELLYDLRNYWSHVDHDQIFLNGAPLEEVNELLLDLYMQACAESKVKIPGGYRGAKGVNVSVVEMGENVNGGYGAVEVNKLSLTGTLFYACLFLDGGQVTGFLESMEQSSCDAKVLHERLKWRKNYPNVPYPKCFTNNKNRFLYARDVYRYWQLRRHGASFAVDEALSKKEACFSMLEYLKSCPKETLTLSGIRRRSMDALVDGYEYEVRKKDEFFGWALAYWDEEMRRLGITDWQWAHHEDAEKIQDARNELEQKAKEAGKPYHFPRYQKVVFGIPQNTDERLSYRNDENRFTYFLLKEVKEVSEVEEVSEVTEPTRAMFRYKHPDGKMVIGLMGGRLLCSVLEWYFYKFPIGREDQEDGDRRGFWMKFFHACFTHIEATQRTAKPKASVSREQVEKRIGFLSKKYSGKIDQPHQMSQFILDTWNQIISYGCTANRECANDSKGRLGAKNGYRELLRYLLLMDSNGGEEQRKQAHKSLTGTLKQLGRSKSIESYFQVINSAFSECEPSASPFPLKKALTVCQHFDLCRQYREKMLDKFEKKLAAEFNVDDWRPAYEMRWLGLRDARTPQSARQASPATAKAPLQTDVVNVDSGSYPAAGLPRDVRHLKDEAWQSYLKTLNGGCVEKIHSQIYPSPNGCTLLIPAFYENATYTPANKHAGSIRDHKRLYLIRRQDTVLSHIAYKKWCSVAEGTLHNLILQNVSCQMVDFSLPVGGLFIHFYYREFKQDRYLLPPNLTEKICNLLQSRGIVRKGAHIDFSSMKPSYKSILAMLTKKQQYRKLLTQQEQALPVEEKEKVWEERFARLEPLIFYPTREEGRFYFDELFQSYLICRRTFLNKIYQLEETYTVDRKAGERYADFDTYANSLAEKGYLDEAGKRKLIAIRNAAIHNDIPPQKYLPQDNNLVKTVQNTTNRQYFNYFGEGILLINSIMAQLSAPTQEPEEELAQEPMQELAQEPKEEAKEQDKNQRRLSKKEIKQRTRENREKRRKRREYVVSDYTFGSLLSAALKGGDTSS